SEGTLVKGCIVDTLEEENCDDDAVFADSAPRYKEKIQTGKKEHIVDYDDSIFYHQYDPDAAEKNGLLLQYYGECPKGFEEVKMNKDIRVREVQKVNIHPPSDPRYLSSMSPSKERLCTTFK